MNPITVSEGWNITTKLDEIGVDATSQIVFLPQSFESAKPPNGYSQLSEAATVKTLFRENQILFGEPEISAHTQNNSIEWVGPALFYSAALLAENPHIVSISLGVIANYLTDFFKGTDRSDSVNLEISIETTRSKRVKTINYKGNVDGLHTLPEIVKTLNDE